jgi:uncharacterized membrane protein YjfL (UPF0719 family)
MNMHLPMLAVESWQTVPDALGQMTVFAAAGVILLLISFKIFDKVITKIDLEHEISKGNIAAAILASAVLIAMSIILAMAMI